MKIFKSEERKGYNKKYNIYMDALFLIPYLNKQIKGNKFAFPQYELFEIRVVDRQKINDVFDILSADNNVGFNKYLYLGGKKRKTFKNKKHYKKRKTIKNKKH
jgi:hypothetical protein